MSSEIESNDKINPNLIAIDKFIDYHKRVCTIIISITLLIILSLILSIPINDFNSILNINLSKAVDMIIDIHNKIFLAVQDNFTSAIFAGLSCVIYISLILLYINIQGKLELLRLKLHYWIIHEKSFEEKFVRFTFNIFMVYILIALGTILVNVTVLLINYLHVGYSGLYNLLIYTVITVVFVCFMIVSLSPRSDLAVALLEFDKTYNQATDNKKIPCTVIMIALVVLLANIAIGVYLTSLS